MPAVTRDRLVEALMRSPVLSAEQRAQLPDLFQHCQDSRALAEELVRRGWLTVFQINHVAQGRSAELVLGPYVLLQRLGEGGMGQVFKARQTSLERIVALKVVRPECLANQRFIRRFLRESRAASQLTHPNVVRAYDADQVNGTYYIAMEYVEGIDMSRLVKQSGPLPVWLACDLIRQAALGLQHAFENGLIHRDIKPANLLIAGIKPLNKRGEARGSDGQLPTNATPVVKITDFGLARWTEDDADRPVTHLTQIGSVLGTPDYISPEQARNSSTCDIRADLYSLGCTFYYLLAGQAPFPSGTLTDKLMAHQLDVAEPVGKARRARLATDAAQHPNRAGEEHLQVPAAVEQIVVKLLAKHPQERYQTPMELATALASVQERLARGALPVPPQSQPETLIEPDFTPGPAAPSPTLNAILVAPSAVTKSAAGITPTEAIRLEVAPARLRATTAARRRVWPWVLAAALAIVPLIAVAVGLSLLAAWSSFGGGTDQRDPDHVDAGDEAQWNKLLLKAQKKPPLTALRHDLFAFRTQFPGSAHIREVDDWLGRLPSPFDKLDRVMLPRVPLVTAKSPPEMVGALGEHRGYFTKAAGIVALSPDGRWLMGVEEPALRFWDTGELSRAPARLDQPHPKRIHAAVFSPDGKWLATAGDEATVRLWDAATRERGMSLAKHQAHVTRLAFSRDGALLASAGGDGKIWLWDPVTGTGHGSVASAPDEVQSLAFSPDGDALFWGTANQVRWVRIARGAASSGKPSELAVPGPVRVLAFSPDGHALVCGGGKGIVLACSWDGRRLAERGRLLHEVAINKSKQVLLVNQAVFAPDGKTIATGGSDHRVRLWDAQSLALQKEWDLQCPVVAVAFAPDGRHVISGNGNSTLTIFRLSTYTASALK